MGTCVFPPQFLNCALSVLVPVFVFVHVCVSIALYGLHYRIFECTVRTSKGPLTIYDVLTRFEI